VEDGGDYFGIPEWNVGASLVAVGPQFFVGDDGNQNPQLPAYWYVNLRTTYQLRKDVQLFGLVTNLFDNKFATYGTFFDTSGIALITTLTDPRTITPAQPLSVYAGIRVSL